MSKPKWFVIVISWLIIIVLGIAVFSYFGMFGGQSEPDWVYFGAFQAPIPNIDNAIASKETLTIKVKFKNQAGAPINITGASEENKGDCGEGLIPITVLDLEGKEIREEIPNGASFVIQWHCKEDSYLAVQAKLGKAISAEQLSFKYLSTFAGIEHTHSGWIRNIEVV